MLRHEARLRAFLGRVAGPADGDELAQEAFLRAWQRSGDYRGEGGYWSWLAGIGWRLFLDQARRDRRRSGLAVGADDAETMVPPESGAALDLARLFAWLSPQERAVITLCLGHGHSHGEAAAILDLPLGTVKSLLQRGRERLQSMAGAGDVG
jgi:RNA polymerase sigma factor (sigma-70 family)